MKLVLRWVDDNLIAHEDFIGLYETPSVKANVIVSTITDTLIHMNLTLSKVRGQCCDGASNMSNSRNGVAKQIEDMQRKALYCINIVMVTHRTLPPVILYKTVR